MNGVQIVFLDSCGVSIFVSLSACMFDLGFSLPQLSVCIVSLQHYCSNLIVVRSSCIFHFLSQAFLGSYWSRRTNICCMWPQVYLLFHDEVNLRSIVDFFLSLQMLANLAFNIVQVFKSILLITVVSKTSSLSALQVSRLILSLSLDSLAALICDPHRPINLPDSSDELFTTDCFSFIGLSLVISMMVIHFFMLSSHGIIVCFDSVLLRLFDFLIGDLVALLLQLLQHHVTVLSFKDVLVDLGLMSHVVLVDKLLLCLSPQLLLVLQVQIPLLMLSKLVAIDWLTLCPDLQQFSMLGFKLGYHNVSSVLLLSLQLQRSVSFILSSPQFYLLFSPLLFLLLFHPSVHLALVLLSSPQPFLLPFILFFLHLLLSCPLCLLSLCPLILKVLPSLFISFLFDLIHEVFSLDCSGVTDSVVVMMILQVLDIPDATVDVVSVILSLLELSGFPGRLWRRDAVVYSH